MSKIKTLSVVCPCCGRTHIIRNPIAIAHYEAGIDVVCLGCEQPEADACNMEYRRGHID
jgi:hypothetical protein